MKGLYYGLIKIVDDTKKSSNQKEGCLLLEVLIVF